MCLGCTRDATGMGGWPVKLTSGVSREAWHAGLVQVPGLDMSPYFVPYETC